MSAEEVWHAQMEAVRRGDWDTMSGYFAPGCTWTLMPPGTTFRGPGEIVTFMRSGFDAGADREEPAVRNEFATDEWGFRPHEGSSGLTGLTIRAAARLE